MVLKLLGTIPPFLMFADDLVVFSHASHSDLEAIQDCLN